MEQVCALPFCSLGGRDLGGAWESSCHSISDGSSRLPCRSRSCAVKSWCNAKKRGRERRPPRPAPCVVSETNDVQVKPASSRHAPLCVAKCVAEFPLLGEPPSVTSTLPPAYIEKCHPPASLDHESHLEFLVDAHGIKFASRQRCKKAKMLKEGFEPRPTALRTLRATKTTRWRRTTHCETDSHYIFFMF